MSVSIKIAQSDEEKQKVYKLRYKVYIEEMRRTSNYIDVVKKTIEDPFEDSSVIFYAEDGGEVVGTLRMNMNENIPEEYVKLYQIEKLLSKFPKNVSMTSKYVVEESYRKTSVASRLATEGFMYGLNNGIMFNIIDTNPYLLRLYQKMGYRIYTNNISHPEYGNVIPMIIFDDYNYLNSVRSPFRAIYKDKPINHDSLGFFTENYSQHAGRPPLFSLSDEEIFSLVTEAIQGEPCELLSFLYNFSENDCKRILKYFDYVAYNKDTVILQESHAPREFYCVLNGKVKLTILDDEGNTNICILSKGDIFGGPSLTINKKNIKLSGVVEEDSQFLLINDTEIAKLQKRDPEMTEKFMENVKDHSSNSLIIGLQRDVG